jgi:glycosyltransferase involved in cell wall biosynthesis
VFLGGVGEREMEGLLQSTSYYVSASLSDGASSSLLEAMASGLFPIVSDIPANREWITHEENGLLFPPGDHVTLAACLGRAIKNESWMDGARDTNRQLVRERADADTNMAGLAELLRGRASTAHAADIAPVLACSL